MKTTYDYYSNDGELFVPSWEKKKYKCKPVKRPQRKLKEICSFFGGYEFGTTDLVMPNIKPNKSNNNDIDYSKRYLTLEAVDDCNFVFFGQDAFVDFAYIMAGGQITKEQARQMIQGGGEGIKYSLDGGKTWNEPEEQVIHIRDFGSVSVDLSASTIPQVLAGQNVMLKGVNDGMSCDEFGFVASCGVIKSDGKYKASGNIMSIAYGDDFIGQTSMSGKGFQYLFSYGFVTGDDDFSLIDAGNLILPATTLSKGCYDSMFNRCASLTTAPELPATILADYCYASMFSRCTSLTAAPELPATTLAEDCYQTMFGNCTSLTEAPELPATTLAEGCYYYMFYGCTSLVTAPELPARTLVDSCYYYMFYGCTSLVTAPELPARTLVDSCYYYMFFGCSSLNYIKCLATDISANSCTCDWVHGVSDSGTFVKAIEDWPTGGDGIPEGWTVEDDR